MFSSAATPGSVLRKRAGRCGCVAPRLRASQARARSSAAAQLCAPPGLRSHQCIWTYDSPCNANKRQRLDGQADWWTQKVRVEHTVDIGHASVADILVGAGVRGGKGSDLLQHYDTRLAERCARLCKGCACLAQCSKKITSSQFCCTNKH